MSTSLPLAALARPLTLAGGWLLLATSSAHAQSRYTLHGAAAVYDLAGTVRVVPGSGRDVVVDVARGGRDGGRLRVETGDVGGSQAVRVVFPDGDVVYPAMRGSRVRTRVRSDGTFGDAGGSFSGAREVEIRGSGSGTEAWADLTVAVPPGQRLDLHLVAGDATVTNVDGDLSIDVHAASVTADRTRGRLKVDAGSGEVRVTGAQGDVDLDTGSGAVELRGVRASRLRVDGGSGSLEGSDVGAATVELDLGSGGARLARVDARTLKLDSGSGTVDLEFVGDVDDVRIDSGSGAVTLRVPPTLGATLDVDTGSGGIETDVPIVVQRRERDHLTGRLGDGKGRIVIDGGSGRVRIVKS